MNQIEWNTVILDEFLKIGYLSEDEKTVLEMSVTGNSRLKIAQKLNMSASNVDKLIRRIRNKYDSCQKFSAILPERKKSSRKMQKEKNKVTV